jgi:peptidoglycan/xylan/chitin deacetylase (PgdA/CDA1 family)
VYAPRLLTGAATMPDRTLCLTFDDGPGATDGDGPGPRTLPLARYLADEGVRATFFMTGRHVARMPDAPGQVRALGHLVGNHSWSHPDLVQLLADGGDVAAEIVTTDPLVADGSGAPVPMRPPYGSWSAQVAQVVNAATVAASSTRVGPVGWDVNTDDWALWRDGVDAEQAARVVVARIEEVGRGVVLLHDSTADHVEYQAGNLAYETMRLAVPELRTRGFRFVGLDEVTLT